MSATERYGEIVNNNNQVLSPMAAEQETSQNYLTHTLLQHLLYRFKVMINQHNDTGVCIQNFASALSEFVSQFEQQQPQQQDQQQQQYHQTQLHQNVANSITENFSYSHHQQLSQSHQTDHIQLPYTFLPLLSSQNHQTDELDAIPQQQQTIFSFDTDDILHQNDLFSGQLQPILTQETHCNEDIQQPISHQSTQNNVEQQNNNSHTQIQYESHIYTTVNVVPITPLNNGLDNSLPTLAVNAETRTQYHDTQLNKKNEPLQIVDPTSLDVIQTSSKKSGKRKSRPNDETKPRKRQKKNDNISTTTHNIGVPANVSMFGGQTTINDIMTLAL